MTSNTELRIARLTRVFLHLMCMFLQFMNLSLAVCSKDMNECKVGIHNSMERKNIFLCVDNPDYRLNALTLLETECDDIDQFVQPGINDTYDCTLLNTTTDAPFNNRQFICKQLMVIECFRRVPMVSTTEAKRRDDDDSDGGDDGSDAGAMSARAFGRGSNDDDDNDSDLVLEVQLQRPGTNETPCNIFINVSMKELGLSEDDDDVCEDITSENFNFCLNLCINNTFNTVDICMILAQPRTVVSIAAVQPYSDLAESILERNSVEDDDVDSVFDVLSALSSLNSSVSGLNATVEIVGNLVGIFTANSSLINIDRGQALAAIIDQTISEDRLDDWKNLQQGPERYQSSNLLNSLEMIQSLLAGSVENQGDFHFLGNNIQMLAVERVAEEDVTSGVYNFPAQTNINGLTRLEIPRDVLCASDAPINNTETGCFAVVSAAIVQNLPIYLDQISSQNSNQRTNSLLMSVRVQNVNKKVYVDDVLQDLPVVIYFTALNQNVTPEGTDCVFWNFTDRQWSSSGLNTTVDTSSNTIRCVSNHLTSFAVLVDVNGIEGDSAEVYALKLVTYAGCVVSLICLALSLLVLISCGKQLKKGVLLYIHVNFIIALGLALLVFVTGIETAARIREVCAVVAGLLHYLFLCVFCWMLAEGIMLYLLVVRVFGTIASRWYYLLILGWGLPIPIVAISAGIRFEDYGNGTVCWLSTNSGTVWSFIGPMIAIIVANSIILVLTLRSLLRGKKFRQSSDTCGTTKLTLVWSSLKSTIILLPLLGITWIIGVLAINENTTVFAWLFTILNSLQGFFIFIFHVLRNDKVKSSVKQFFRYSFRCCVCKETQRRGSTITLTKSNSVTLATTNTNCQDSERASDHPVIGRSYSETSQDSSLDFANFIIQK